MTVLRTPYAGYDVLRKRDSVSWDDTTREVVRRRLEEVPERSFFTEEEWHTLQAVCDRIVPQPERGSAAVPIAPWIDQQLAQNRGDGYRYADMPPLRDAWQLGLVGIDRESRRRFGESYAATHGAHQDAVLSAIQQGDVTGEIWTRLRLANSSGMVGKCLMVHSNNGVFGEMDEEIRWYKGPPCLAITEHWNSTDVGKDFHGGYLFGSQGPLIQDWAQKVATITGVWGMRLREQMTRYNHMAGFKMVGEVEPQERNRVELDDEVDALGLRIPRVIFSYSDNDKRLIAHAVKRMRDTLEAAGGRRLMVEEDTAHLMGGCRMGLSPSDSVSDSDGRTWDIPNLWICDGSLFPTGTGVNPSLTIMALACRIGDRIVAHARRNELDARPKAFGSLTATAPPDAS